MLLGGDAIGRYAIGQISQAQNANVALSGVAGGGAVGTIPFTDRTSLVGVAGAGSAGTILDSGALPLSGVAGIGAGGIVTPSVSSAMTGVLGAGSAGSTANFFPYQLIGVAGGGLAGSPQGSSSSPTLIGVAGIGSAGTITADPSAKFIGAFGAGLAGTITIAISGGGGGRLRRDPRMRTGFEPVKKVYRAPEQPAPEPKIEPPPTMLVRAPRPPVAPRPPAPLIDERLIPDVSALIQQIVEAEAASRRQRQDEEDISELMAFLEAQDKQA